MWRAASKVTYFQDELQRLLQSETLSHSQSLRRLLGYLAEKSFIGKAAKVSELTLGVEALGKPNDYDPQIDPSVRVQVGRLRSKLAQYYMDEGANDPVVVTLPKGHFQLKFERRFPRSVDVQKLRNRARWFQALSSVLGIFAVAFALTDPFTRTKPGHRSDSSRGVAAEITATTKGLWGPYLRSDSPTLLCLGVPLFVQFDLPPRYAELSRRVALREPSVNVWSEAERSGWLDKWKRVFHAAAVRPYYNYTPAGEAVAAILISQHLSSLGVHFSVVRSNSVAWESIEASNVIFIGAPKFNPQLRIMELTKNFEIGGQRVRNKDPRPGEQNFFPSLKADLGENGAALIGRYRRPGGGGILTVLASPNSIATWAAAQYLTRPDYAARFLRELAQADGEVPRYFESVIQVRIDKDYPVEIHVAVHRALVFGKAGGTD